MNKSNLMYAVLAGLLIFSVFHTINVLKLKKELRSTEKQLSSALDNLKEANNKSDEISQEFNLRSVNTPDLKNKLDAIESSASQLESSIESLIREIRWASCDACQSTISDIERKAKSVKADFENLASEIH